MRLLFDQLENLTKELKDQNKTIALCHGCFVNLHEGHHKLFSEAKKYADIVMVGVESGEYLLKKKGSGEFLNQQERIRNIENTNLVDIVFALPAGENSMYKEIYKKIHPNFLVTAVDEVLDKKKKDAESFGIKVISTEK